MKEGGREGSSGPLVSITGISIIVAISGGLFSSSTYTVSLFLLFAVGSRLGQWPSCWAASLIPSGPTTASNSSSSLCKLLVVQHISVCSSHLCDSTPYAACNQSTILLHQLRILWGVGEMCVMDMFWTVWL